MGCLSRVHSLISVSLQPLWCCFEYNIALGQVSTGPSCSVVCHMGLSIQACFFYILSLYIVCQSWFLNQSLLFSYGCMFISYDLLRSTGGDWLGIYNTWHDSSTKVERLSNNRMELVHQLVKLCFLLWLPEAMLFMINHTAHPRNFPHSLNLVTMCFGKVWAILPIPFRVTSLAQAQSYDCHSISKATITKIHE